MKAHEPIDEYWACDDCTIATCNGDFTGMDDARATLVRLSLENVAKRGYLALNDTPEDEGRIEFSNAGCDCCGSRLAGSLTRFALFPHAE